jgi:DNA-binding GntR family transcriptional regulator
MSFGAEITLDRTSPVPLYFQVAEQFERAIVSGSIPPGEKITNEVTLAQDLGLSRPTMRQAIQVLVDRGLVVRKRGVGTQVVHGNVRRSLELTSLYDDLRAAGQEPRTDILGLVRVAANTDVALELQLEQGAEVWSLTRLRWIGDQPLALMHNYLPVSLADLESFDLAGDGLYASLRRSGIEIRVAKQRISARGALSDEAHHLGEPAGAPLLTMQRTAYNNAGLAVEYGRHAYRPELYAFELTLVHR